MIDPAAEAIAQAFEGKASVKLRRGLFLAVDSNLRARVTIDSHEVSVDFVAGPVPEQGEPVHVWTIDDQYFMAGTVKPKPGVGTVVSVSGAFLVASTVIGDIRMDYVGAAPAVNDIVAILWSQGPHCVGKLSSTPAPPVAPTPTPEVNTFSAVFNVIDTGSTDRPSVRWWTDQPWASNSTFGAWFYGSQLKDTIPASASLVSLEFYVNYVQRQGASPNFALHNQPTKAGLPSFGASTVWNPNPGWQVPPDPTGWFNALKSGGGSYGVGLNQGGFNKFASRAQDGLSGALRISWKA